MGVGEVVCGGREMWQSARAKDGVPRDSRTGLDWTGHGNDYAKAVLCLNSLVERRFSKALMGENMSGRELKRNE